MPRQKSSSTRVSRRTSEQHRRNQMKTLFSNLASVLQLRVQPSMERMTVPAFLEHARAYVKALKKRVKELKKKKQDFEAEIQNDESNLPVVAVNEMNDSGDLEVNLIVGINKNIFLSEVLSILEEEGGDILSVNYTTVGCKIVHTIICQAMMARIGIDALRVLERLNILLFERYKQV